MILVILPHTGALAAEANPAPAPGANNGNGAYILHPGDMLSINVFGYPELSFPNQGHMEGLTIRPDGKLTYPFLGEIAAKGMTVLPSKLIEPPKFSQPSKSLPHPYSSVPDR